MPLEALLAAMSSTVPTVSRKELAEWATRTCGERITSLERQCASGVIFCQLLAAVRPEALDAKKIRPEQDTLGNYRELRAALAQVGRRRSTSTQSAESEAAETEALMRGGSREVLNQP